MRILVGLFDCRQQLKVVCQYTTLCSDSIAFVISSSPATNATGVILFLQTEMTTAERELDQNTNFDWNRIQEKGKELEPLFGPGFTGLANLGNRSNSYSPTVEDYILVQIRALPN